MLGAIIGDIAGSRFEFDNRKSKHFALFTDRCRPTDDSIMTLAVAQALLDCKRDYTLLSQKAIYEMQKLGCLYPNAGYGGSFCRWLYEDAPVPYHSYGNGAGMRVSPCAWAADTLCEAKALAEAVTAVSHDHPEGLKGAEAITMAVFMARHGSSKEEIRQEIVSHYYPLDFTLDSIRAGYTFDVSCQGSVPQAIAAFLESADFEDAIRGAVSIGGDSDTIAAMTGSIAEAFYGIPQKIRKEALAFLDDTMTAVVRDFEAAFPAGGAR